MSQDNIVNSLCNIKIENSVAFDFDGTLVNCKIRQVEVLQSILRRKEINIRDFNINKWWKYKRNGLNTFDALVKMQINTKTAEYISNCWISNIENPEWLDLDSLFDCVIPMLNRLKELDKNVYIITARKSEHFFLNQIRKLCVDQYIKKYFVVTPFNSIEQKREILNQLKPSLYFGDSENDFYSAQKSGVKFIAVSTGQRSKQFLKMCGVDFIIDDISELSFRNKYLMFMKKMSRTGQNCVIHKNTLFGKNVAIGNNVTIENNVTIGNNVTICNNVTIYDNVRIEDDVYLWDNCVVGRMPMGSKSIMREISVIENTIIKNNSIVGCGCVIYTGAVIGKDNIIGDCSIIRENVIFGDEVIVGFNTTISYNVIIGRGTRVLQQSAVSAYTEIGADNFISIGFVSVSDRNFKDKGFTEDSNKGPKIGDNNNIGPHVTIISNVEIGNFNTIGAHALITKNVNDNGVYYGVPAKLIKTKSL